MCPTTDKTDPNSFGKVFSAPQIGMSRKGRSA